MSLFSFIKKKRIGLALGGGAARGLAHIGVIKVLQEEHIPVHYMAGTSIGSIVGAFYASGYGWQEMREFAGRLKWGKIVKFALPTLGFVKRDRFKQLLETVFGTMHLKDLIIPFKAVCVDVISGEQVILEDGPVITAILASSSIPIIFEPVEYGGKILVDGGLTNNVPADIVRGMGADVVISVDLNRDIREYSKPQNLFDMIYASYKIVINNSAMQQCDNCSDIVITPQLRGYSYYDLSKVSELMACGEQAMHEKIKELKKFIS